MNLDGRIHFLDAARAILMLLGIPYHIALVYMVGEPWDFATSDERSRLLSVLADFIHVFRMPLFFLVAGYFSMMILSRSTPGRWFGGRVFKLGVPMLVVGVLLNPISLIVQPDSAMLLADFGDQWLAHLWFLPTLIYFCGLLALMRATPLQRWFQLAVDRIATRPAVGAIVFVLLAGGFSGGGSLLGNRMPETFLVTTTFTAAVGFLPFLMLGAAMRMNDRILVSMSSSSFSAFAVTLVPLAFVLNTTWGGSLLNVARVFAVSVVCFGFARALLTFCRLRLDDPSRRVRRIADASFTIYLVHMPLLNVSYRFIEPLDLPVLLDFASMVVLVTAGSYAAHRLIARSGVLMFLFNGAPLARRRHADDAGGMRASK